MSWQRTIRRVYCIVNRAAANGRLAKRWPALAECLAAAGARFVLTEGPGHAVLLAEAACAKGEELVVAVGGDGTVNEVFTGLDRGGRGPVFAVLPAGTGNDAARAMGWPSSLERACKLLLATTATRPYDLGRCGHLVFANGCGLGFGGRVSHVTDGRKLLPGMLSYLVATLVQLPIYRGPKAVIEGGGERFEGDVMLIEIGNGRYCGGGFQLTPHALPDDGLLDCCVIRKTGIPGALKMLALAPKGRHLGSASCSYRRAAEIEVVLDRPVHVHLDGNLHTLLAGRHRIVCDHQALHVLDPRKAQ